jgi:galactose mutarotase-like enzyme
VKAAVTYTLTDADELRVEMTAVTDKPTVVNLAHHSYWNLAGHASGDILGQVLQVNAEAFTPTDETLIPHGTTPPVDGTPYDFRRGMKVGEDIDVAPGGYDLNYVLNGKPGELRWAARLRDPNSGRQMEILTTEPGLQVYSGNFLDGTVRGKGGAVYAKHQGLCLETQHFPDSINRPGWPSVVLRPGETYRHVMIHRFTVK